MFDDAFHFVKVGYPGRLAPRPVYRVYFGIGGTMAIPLDRLMQDDRNIYELTSAIIRRAHQIGEIRRAFSSDEHGSVNDDGEKVVTQAINEVVLDQVHFEMIKD
jgi:DNA-directed RNA polymerase subunit K/omega